MSISFLVFNSIDARTKVSGDIYGPRIHVTRLEHHFELDLHSVSSLASSFLNLFSQVVEEWNHLASESQTP